MLIAFDVAKGALWALVKLVTYWRLDRRRRVLAVHTAVITADHPLVLLVCSGAHRVERLLPAQLDVADGAQCPT